MKQLTFLVEIEFPVFGFLLGLGFVSFLVDSFEDRVRHFRLPTLRNYQRKVLVELLVFLGQLGNKPRDWMNDSTD